MRLAFLSDVHGNLEALEAVWQDIRRRGADSVLCAGDLVSFGPRPAEVADFFRQHNIAAVMGNHDAVATGLADTGQFVFQNDAERRYINDAVTATARYLGPEQIQYLRGLPEELCLEDERLLLVHSVPDMFAYPDMASMNRAMCGRKERFLFFGHTHRPGMYTLDNGKIAVNLPGLGKPKHGDALAGYCIAEIEAGSLAGLQFLFVDYDRRRVCAEIRERGFPSQTISFLESGIQGGNGG